MGYQTCKYRMKNGEIESQMFDSDEIPDGWEDSPACFKNGGEPVIENPPEAMPKIERKPRGMFKKKSRKRGD